MTIHTGDCVEVMAAMPEASVDAVVTDPPYGLEFMGKEWDRLAGDWNHDQGRGEHALATGRPSGRRGWDGMGPRPRYHTTGMQQWHQQWATAALRVAKPGAYLLAFGGTRTVHRMTCALEDAGWVIRDMLVWAYASGFPKSRALLKPAWEPIVMARKPGPLRDLDIDGCRIGGDASVARVRHNGAGTGDIEQWRTGARASDTGGAAGRWPANVVLTDPVLDGDRSPQGGPRWEGVVGGGETGPASDRVRHNGAFQSVAKGAETERDSFGYRDTGTYSRFFLVPKASRSDREPVMPGMLEEREDTRVESAHSTVCATCGRQRVNVPGAACVCPDPQWVRKPQTKRANVHPTVKPIELMRHLVRLVTPAGGVVLDPFGGSGTTALAAEQEGREWLLIEREAEYVRIAEARLAGWQRGLGLEEVS